MTEDGKKPDLPRASVLKRKPPRSPSVPVWHLLPVHTHASQGRDTGPVQPRMGLSPSSPGSLWNPHREGKRG